VAYATAWRVKHKLLEAMAQRESARLLRGVVVVSWFSRNRNFALPFLVGRVPTD